MASQEAKSEVVAAARADAARNRERILSAAGKLLAQSPGASLGEIATAAGVSRSTIYRHFDDRAGLIEEARELPRGAPRESEELLPPGELGREEPVPLDPVQVLDAVAAPLLPEQLVAEAQRVAGVPLGLYVLDIDGSHLLRMAGPARLPEMIEANLAVGPEMDGDGLALLRQKLAGYAGIEIVPLWLRGRAIGVLLTLGQPRAGLAELARQAAAAVAMADRYTDAFARAQRRKQPKAAAEIQQSLLPPRIARFTGAEVAGNVLPSYEVAGDWFDVVENQDGVWLTIADGLGSGTRAIASAAVALGALRASRRSDGTIKDALMVMHRTLKEMPGPQTEMSAVLCHWDPATRKLTVANCGHVPPVVIRSDGTAEKLKVPKVRGLGGRGAPEPAERSTALGGGDRLVMVSDGVVADGKGKAGLGMEGLIDAAMRSQRSTAPDTVREIHAAVLDATEGDLDDDATAVCLAITHLS
jgi:serine phosphatase RsbU (regulator of sigma subunit)/DNA-binding transcriptional ArsR family regulator